MFRLLALILIFCLSANAFSHNTIATKAFVGSHVSQQWLQVAMADVVPMTYVEGQMLGTNFLPELEPIAVIKPIQGQLMPTSMAILLLAIGLALIFFDDHLKKSKNRKK